MMRSVVLRLSMATTGLCLGWVVLASTAATAQERPVLPRLEPHKCWFKTPRGATASCHLLSVPENRAIPDGRVVKLPVAILKSSAGDRREADPVIYLAGGPGEAPLAASSPGVDPLKDGDWWHSTAAIRRNRNFIFIGQRGAQLSRPALQCDDIASPKTRLSRTGGHFDAVEDERRAMIKCRAELERRGIDVAQYRTPALADDVADLARALDLTKVNLYGVSYGTRWALEVMRRHPTLVRAAILDSAYPPQINGDQEEVDAVRRAFERLFTTCADDTWCARTYPTLRADLEALVAKLDRTPIKLRLKLAHGRATASIDGTKLMLILLHVMRLGGDDIGRLPTTIARTARGNYAALRFFAQDLEQTEGGIVETPIEQMAGLYYSIECRETTAFVDGPARERAIAQAGIYGLVARSNTGPALCPVWRVPAADPAERQPVHSAVPTLLLSGSYDWLTPSAWAEVAKQSLPNAQHVEFRAMGHAVTANDDCAETLLAQFVNQPDPARVPACVGTNAPPKFTDKPPK
ncbi:alpha/beta hydrolase [Reyranella sp. CPCC 100927]|nr:alpha/beta hydrolase [Reyranella sp. CPCC 100927]